MKFICTLSARDSCRITNYGALYTGFVEILTDDTGVRPQIIYILNSQDTVFALTKKEKQCAAMFLEELNTRNY